MHFRERHYFQDEGSRIRDLYVIADVSTAGYLDCDPVAALSGAAHALFESLMDAVNDLNPDAEIEVEPDIDPDDEGGDCPVGDAP